MKNIFPTTEKSFFAVISIFNLCNVKKHEKKAYFMLKYYFVNLISINENFLKKFWNIWSKYQHIALVNNKYIVYNKKVCEIFWEKNWKSKFSNKY